jgi:hypothetical protein
MQRENERGVPSHWWSVNPLARGLRSAAKQATKIEGSGSAMKMGSTRDWRSATATEMGSDERRRWVLHRDSNPKRNNLSQGGCREHEEGRKKGK